MKVLRTPDERFADLKDYPFAPHYVEVDAGDGTPLRIHYVDESQVDEGQGELLLCLHGQPSWSYLYRKMIPILVDAGHRVIAPDLVGFGRSDKPADQSDYTYAHHVSWMRSFIDALALRNITLVCQDWGSLIGLRVVAENPEWFSRVVVGNGALPDGEGVPDEATPALRALLAKTPALPAGEMVRTFSEPPEGHPAFMFWLRHCDAHPDFHPAEIMELMTRHCDAEEKRAWAAPFPVEEYMAGARQFPSRVPILPDDPAIPANRAAWQALESFDKPFLTAYSDSDPVTKGREKRFIQSVPGAAGRDHVMIQGAGHFLQDDAGPELAQAVIDFVRHTP